MPTDRLTKTFDAAPATFTMNLCGQALSGILDELGVSIPVIIVCSRWGGLVAGGLQSTTLVH